MSKLLHAAAWDIFIATWCFQCVRQTASDSPDRCIYGQSSRSHPYMVSNMLSGALLRRHLQMRLQLWQTARWISCLTRNCVLCWNKPRSNEQLQKMKQNVSKGNTSRNQQGSEKLSYLSYSCGWWSMMQIWNKLNCPVKISPFSFSVSALVCPKSCPILVLFAVGGTGGCWQKPAATSTNTAIASGRAMGTAVSISRYASCPGDKMWEYEVLAI